MAAVWGCAFGAFLKMRNPDEKGLALGYVISAIAGGVTEPALFGILMRFRRTMLGMFIGGAIGAVFSGLMGVTYYLAGGASNFLVFTNYLQGGQMNTVWAIVAWQFPSSSPPPWCSRPASPRRSSPRWTRKRLRLSPSV